VSRDQVDNGTKGVASVAADASGDSPLEPVKDAPAATGVDGLSAADLAELVTTFNEVTQRLESTHTALRSEVVRLSEELRQTKGQLARARELAALGEMAAGIAHEVRNPLGSIRLYAEALVEDLNDRPAERDVADRIVRSVGRLNAVVGDVLAFSRELRLRPETLDATAFLADAIEESRARALERGVRLEVLPVENELTITADPGLLRQALTNVISNAIDAAAEGTSEEPRVEVSAERTLVRTPDGGRTDAVGIRVADSGPGIPDAVRDRLFNPFFTTRETGTGLGLAIVHRIVDAHAGTVVIHENGLAPAGAAVELKLPSSAADHRPATELALTEHKPIRQTRSVGV